MGREEGAGWKGSLILGRSQPLAMSGDSKAWPTWDSGSLRGGPQRLGTEKRGSRKLQRLSAGVRSAPRQTADSTQQGLARPSPQFAQPRPLPAVGLRAWEGVRPVSSPSSVLRCISFRPSGIPGWALKPPECLLHVPRAASDAHGSGHPSWVGLSRDDLRPQVPGRPLRA